MYRFLTLPAALFTLTGAARAEDPAPPPVQVEEVQLQVQVAQPAVQVQVGGDINLPATTTPGKPGEKKEFKPAADASPDPKSLVVADNLLLKAKELVKQLGSA